MIFVTSTRSFDIRLVEQSHLCSFFLNLGHFFCFGPEILKKRCFLLIILSVDTNRSSYSVFIRGFDLLLISFKVCCILKFWSLYIFGPVHKKIYFQTCMVSENGIILYIDLSCTNILWAGETEDPWLTQQGTANNQISLHFTLAGQTTEGTIFYYSPV